MSDPLSRLQTLSHVTGIKQSKRAIAAGNAETALIAADADSHVTEPIVTLCTDNNVPIERVDTMEELGHAAGIDVGCAVVVLLRH